MGSELAVSSPRFSFGELNELATVVAATTTSRSKSQMLTLMMLCDSEGLHPMQAIRRYHVIQGQITMRADAMHADFQKAGGFIFWAQTDAKVCEGRFVHQLHSPEPGLTIRLTMEDAVAAGLTKTNPNYAKYPAQMLRARVISQGVRAILPGLCTGIYTAEDMGAMIDVQGQVLSVEPVAAPQVVPVRASVAAAPQVDSPKTPPKVVKAALAPPVSATVTVRPAATVAVPPVATAPPVDAPPPFTAAPFVAAQPGLATPDQLAQYNHLCSILGQPDPADLLRRFGCTVPAAMTHDEIADEIRTMGRSLDLTTGVDQIARTIEGDTPEAARTASHEAVANPTTTGVQDEFFAEADLFADLAIKLRMNDAAVNKVLGKRGVSSVMDLSLPDLREINAKLHSMAESVASKAKDQANMDHIAAQPTSGATLFEPPAPQLSQPKPGQSAGFLGNEPTDGPTGADEDYVFDEAVRPADKLTDKPKRAKREAAHAG